MEPSRKYINQKFGRYQILEHLATGGMAKIYKASTSNGRIFTLKKVLQEYAQNEDFLRMFLEEAKISLIMKHPQIVRVLDFGQLDGSYYLAMEYVFGKDLGSFLKRSYESKTAVPVDIACHIIRQCCRALEYAHTLTDSFGQSRSVVHRDISPPNILLSYNGEAKILDFGIAKAIRLSSMGHTRSGVLKGKFCYMSPEQARGENLNHQSDLFSLGIVFHELLTSQSLFYSQDEIETLERVRKADVQPPSSYRNDVPKELDRILLKMMAPKLKHRYQSAREIERELQSFLKEHYPRTDDRNVAKCMRSMFRKDFQFRGPQAKQEGWKDLLVSGGADDELLLDRSADKTQGKVQLRQATGEIAIPWWTRLIYDPKINRRFKRSLMISSLSIALMGSLWLFYHSEAGKISIQWAQERLADLSQSQAQGGASELN